MYEYLFVQQFSWTKYGLQFISIGFAAYICLQNNLTWHSTVVPLGLTLSGSLLLTTCMHVPCSRDLVRAGRLIPTLPPAITNMDCLR